MLAAGVDVLDKGGPEMLLESIKEEELVKVDELIKALLLADVDIGVLDTILRKMDEGEPVELGEFAEVLLAGVIGVDKLLAAWEEDKMLLEGVINMKLLSEGVVLGAVDGAAAELLGAELLPAAVFDITEVAGDIKNPVKLLLKGRAELASIVTVWLSTGVVEP